MIDAIEMYNDLIPTMNKLSEDGYDVECHHNRYEGYGFYIEAPCSNNNCYIAINIFGSEFYIRLWRHNSKYSHDPLNDIDLANERTKSTSDVERIIYNFLTKAENESKFINIELTKNDIEYLLSVCSDKSISDKLNKALED